MGELEQHSSWGFETRAVHTGQAPDPVTGAVVTPISLSTTFAQDGVGAHKGFEYSRSGNPTRAALQACVASLEGGRHGLAFASGLAAEDNVLRLLKPGDRVLLGNDAYGGTFRLIDKVHTGLTWSAVNLIDIDKLIAEWPSDTKLVWLETPTNPLLRCFDIEAICEIAHDRGALVCVDNTFATPYLQQPLSLGADVVVHSATKYLGGHSDTILGVVATNDPTIAERLYFLQKSLGAVPGPFDAWLVLRGIKTLAVRMRQHCENAMAIAMWLERNGNVERVLYPGLPSHPGHRIAAKQMRDFGGMVSFLAESEEEAVAICGRTKIWQLAESRGGVESLIEHPARMTHASTAEAPFAAPRNLIRLSVGLESAEDLIADLEAALVRSAAAAEA